MKLVVKFLLPTLLLLSCTQLFAQATASATITGTVMDQSRAAIAGATVTATNKATNEARTVKTNNFGEYRFDLLPAGEYTVTVKQTGFATGSASSVELLVGATSLVDFTLKPGSTSQTVEVVATAPLLDVTKTSVSEQITPTQVEELPLISRDVATLAYLVPGVKAADSYDPTKNRYAILSVNGSTGRNINTTVNGIDNKDNTVGGPVMQLPAEAVQEFVVSTQRFSAANGRSEGAAINIVTKSGSNNYHGSLFGYFRNDALDASQKVANGVDASGRLATIDSNPPYSRQFYGGSVGGPFKKDKVFGFFAYEHQREIQSLAENGNTYLQLVAAEPIGAQASQTIPTPFYETRYNGRLDWRINDRNTAYLSYSSQGNNSLNDQSDGFQDLTAGNFTTNQLIVSNITLNSAFTTTLVNSFTAGYQYWNNLIASQIRAPLITFPGGGSGNCSNGGSCFGTNINVPQQSFQRKWQFRDDLTKTFGKHTLKTGVDYLYEPALGGYFESNSTLEIDFAADPLTITGNPTLYPQGFATSGLITGMAFSEGDPAFSTPNGGGKMLGLYFQDDWKMTRRLTLNLGLRYDKDWNLFGEGAIPQSRTFQEMMAIQPFLPAGFPNYAKVPHEDILDFSPRIGFSYDLTGRGRHILHGGFGIYYGQTFQNIPLFMEQQADPTIYQGVFSITGSDTIPGLNIPLNSWGYSAADVTTILQNMPPPSGTLADGAIGRLMDPHYRNPYSEQVNIGYQWGVTANSVFEAEYVHDLGVHEDKTITINPLINGVRNTDALFAAAGVPVLGSVRDEQSINRSRYDGMNLSYRRRMSKKFDLNANYTLSRALAYGGSAGSFRNYPTNPLIPLEPWNLGPSPTDERHHITISGFFRLPYGISAAPIIQYGSARPISPQLNEGYDVYGYGSGDQRPLIVNNANSNEYWAYSANMFGGSSSAARTAALACLAAGQCHELPFGALRGDPFFETDLRVAKEFKVGEKYRVSLQWQAFNLTNRANYGNDFNGNAGSWNSDPSKNTFLKPAGFINPTSTATPRAMWNEFGFRFSF